MTSPATQIINARLIDPETEYDQTGGLLIKNGLIDDLGPHLAQIADDSIKVIDAAGHIVCPGLIDMQVFAGEPGYEERETLETASEAAAAGGVTTIICTPNTDPVIDDVAIIEILKQTARDKAKVHIHPMGALTKSLRGDQMSEIGLLSDAGAIAFSNGNHSVMNANVMRNLLTYAKDFNALIIHHTEEASLSADGVINEGELSSRLGLKGIPSTSESIMLERDVALVRLTGSKYHAAQISCADSVDIVRRAKKQRLPVTCGVSINHITLNENDIGPYQTDFKFSPPLRTESDRQALIAGLAAGDIDVIISNHEPQDEDSKDRSFAEASNGAIGLETMLPAALRLYHNEQLSLFELLKPMTINPAKILNLPSGRLQKGAPADIIILASDIPWIVDRNRFKSRSKNTPLDKTTLQGQIIRTLVAGQTVHQYPASN